MSKKIRFVLISKFCPSLCMHTPRDCRQNSLLNETPLTARTELRLPVGNHTLILRIIISYSKKCSHLNSLISLRIHSTTIATCLKSSKICCNNDFVRNCLPSFTTKNSLKIGSWHLTNSRTLVDYCGALSSALYARFSATFYRHGL